MSEKKCHFLLSSFFSFVKKVLNKFIAKIGVDSEKFKLVDVIGLEDDTLAFLPKPVLAFVLLFPCSENYEKHRKEEDEKLSADKPKVPEDLFYMKQYLNNACGSIALFHAILNNLDVIELKVILFFWTIL